MHSPTFNPELKNLHPEKIEINEPVCGNIEKSIFDVFIGDIAQRVEPIEKDAKIEEPFLKFMENERLNLLPVVDGRNVVGQLHRHRFLENVILGKLGYGLHLNSKKRVFHIMEKPTYLVDYYITLEEAANLVQKKELKILYDDIIICRDGEYYGIVPINILLETITQKAILLAKDANPLTGLPGNWAIQREIEKKIKLGCTFDVCYIDINSFKPYNDHYGFEQGDKVIVSLGNILKEIASLHPEIFVGHIGGDDFILVTPPHISETICESIIRAFENLLTYFHKEDITKGYYISKNRKGETEVFPLLSLSIAIVSTETRRITSFAQLASIASEVKAEAKKLSKLTKKSTIFKDRRRDKGDNYSP
ncbi:MAG: GGDEF domain-containing protein [Caldimicrobium sp.]